jgi:hypothetical protein
VALACAGPPGAGSNGPPVTVSIDATVRHQTMTGWEATAQAGQETPGFDAYKDELFDAAVFELGINRLRLEVRSGVENRRDLWREQRTGALDRGGWRAMRYSTVNDNADPFAIDESGFVFSELDHTVETVIRPMQERLRTRGERLILVVTYVAFTDSIAYGLEYHHDEPEEYAELVQATVRHLSRRHGLAPDLWEVILEPDNSRPWSGTHIGRSIAAAARRLARDGVSLKFVAPSTADMTAAIEYFDEAVAVPGVAEHLGELAYHRYRGISSESLAQLARRASKHRTGLSMLEWIGAGDETLYEDVAAGASAWQQFALAFQADDNGAQYYVVEEGPDGSLRARAGRRTRLLRQYFNAVRAGAVRVNADSSDPGVSPLAFVNPDGSLVAVLRAASARRVRVGPLPAGEYDVSFTTAATEGASTTRVDAGRAVEVELPAAGVATIRGVRS